MEVKMEVNCLNRLSAAVSRLITRAMGKSIEVKACLNRLSAAVSRLIMMR